MVPNLLETTDAQRNSVRHVMLWHCLVGKTAPGKTTHEKLQFCFCRSETKKNGFVARSRAVSGAAASVLLALAGMVVWFFLTRKLKNKNSKNTRRRTKLSCHCDGAAGKQKERGVCLVTRAQHQHQRPPRARRTRCKNSLDKTVGVLQELKAPGRDLLNTRSRRFLPTRLRRFCCLIVWCLPLAVW